MAPPALSEPITESRDSGELRLRIRELDVIAQSKAIALIALMAIGSALMWLGMPLLWLWLASRLQSGASPTLGPYVLVAFGLPLSMAVIGRGLAALDRAFARTTGFDPNARRAHLPWLKSMRGERESGHRRTVLDVVMIASVVVAWAAFGVWFFFFAGSSLPT